MHLAQSVMDMTGSPPEAFTPGWSRGANVSLGPGKDIAVESPTVTLGAAVSSTATIHVTTSRIPQRVVALTLEIRDQGEARASLRNIPFEVMGNPAREVTFNSEHQNTPWGFRLKINSETGQMTLSFTLSYSGLTVDEALAGIRFYEALARGGEFCLRGHHPVTGGELSLARANLPSGTYEVPDSRFIRLLQQLAFIQNKTGVSFAIPESNISFQDANTVAGTADILKTGHAQYTSGPWVSISNVEQARSALESFNSGTPAPMALHFDGQVVVIFGTYVPLGPVTLFCDRTYIAKEDLENLRKDVGAAVPGSSISIRFTPFDACPIEARYIKWLPDDEAAAIKQLPMYTKPDRRGDQDKWALPRTSAHEAITLLKSWYQEDPDEQKKSWEQLKIALDEDRLSDRKLF
jgi:hypothetical protein